ncbi:Fungal-trans domain-containing protein [Fusarium falciforme]|uniref:Fungal-trans domain-containing protein n=1 Tax=Fusarium falciforme TaxID=195108 RepID=UPI0022FFC8A7|nr:Fungal-trans domain-containing protein [Fusarium falciforme]WAO84520.1 Fungal-trans domain-containing protein [Fusarium falciforme]
MEAETPALVLPTTPPRSQRGSKRVQRRRRRIQTACKSCQDRKTRCDGSRPACSACHRRGVAAECIYENSPASASYLSALEQRLQRLEQRQDVESRPPQPAERRVSRNDSIPEASIASREMQASPATQGPYSPNTSRYASNVDGLATVSTTTESECMYGPSSTIAFVQFCNEANRQGSLPESDQQVDELPSAAVPEAIREKDPFAAVYPPRRTADDFVRCFWEFVHPVFPVLHKTSFMNRYNLLWSAEENEANNDNISEMDEVIFSSTLNIVFAIGCRFSESVPAASRASLAQTFYQRSRSIYRFEILDSMSLSAVQMLLLTGVYLQSTQQATRCWNVVGLAIRAGQSLGLHVESPNQPRSQLTREMRRRVWHTCLVLDKLLSMTFGRPAMISTSWHVPLPSLIDDEYLSADGQGEQPQDRPSSLGLLIWSSKLFLILDEILLSFYAPHPQKSVDTMSEGDLNVQQIISDVMVLNRRIEEFFDSIPKYLRLETGSDIIPEQQEVSVTIQKQILNCRSSAWHSVYFTFASAITLLAARTCPAVDAETLASFELAWSHCLVILEYYKEHIQAARRGISTLQELRSRMDLSRSQGFSDSSQMEAPVGAENQQMNSFDLSQFDAMGIDSALGLWLSQDMDSLGWLEFQ